jgi:hypothetical protein
MQARRCLGLQAVLAVLFVQLAAGYYLPGTYPQEFKVGDTLQGESCNARVEREGARTHPAGRPARGSWHMAPAQRRPPALPPTPPPAPRVPAAETNSLVSSETEMPFDYYSMPFCKPGEGVKKKSGTINPGTILLGIRIENSPYKFSMMVRAAAQRRSTLAAPPPPHCCAGSP